MYDYEDFFDIAFGNSFLWSFIGTYSFFVFIVAGIMIIGTWKIYTKAGRNGWASIIPFYSQYVLFEMAGMKGWYIFLIFIPIVGSAIVGIMSIIAYAKLAACFGKDVGFAVGLIFLPVVFVPILGFSDATYTEPIRNN